MRGPGNSTAEVGRLLQFAEEEINADELAVIGQGFSSTVYGSETHVVKVLNANHPTQKSAHEHADVLYGEQEEIQAFIQPSNLVIARFVIGQTSQGDHKVVLTQPRVYGLMVADALALGVSPSAIVNYFSDGLSMYSRLKRIPDFASLERGFNPLIGPNTQVVVTEEEALPVLVDTTFGRTQRQPYLGKFINNGIARGVRRALRQLQ